MRVLRRLCDAGGLDRDPADGSTALAVGAAAGEAGAVSLLLELRADVALGDAVGATALHHCAAARGGSRCATLLLEARADIDAADAHGNTPLHAAGRCAQAELYRTLLEAGAQAHALNDRGRPPKLLEQADGACAIM